MSLSKGSPEYLHELSKKLRRDRILTTCVDCIHFYQEDNRYSCEFFGAVPPLEHIVTGCKNWSQK